MGGGDGRKNAVEESDKPQSFLEGVAGRDVLSLACAERSCVLFDAGTLGGCAECDGDAAKGGASVYVFGGVGIGVGFKRCGGVVGEVDAVFVGAEKVVENMFDEL